MRLTAPWSKITCPACCFRFHLCLAERRLSDVNAPQEPDTKLGRFLSRPAPNLAKVEPPTRGGLFGRAYRRLVIHDDGRASWKKVCPECHFPLPHKTATGEVKSEFFAIIGARNAGKSNYFAVLLKLLERRYAAEVGFTIFDQETLHISSMTILGSSVLYRERYGEKLWDPDDRMAIPQTPSLAQNVEFRIPLIYRIESRKRPVQYLTRPLARVNAIHAVVFDAAGEDMNDPIRLEQFYRYISGAAGIVFLIDPFQYPGIREQLSPELRKRFRIEVEPSEIVSRVIDLFQRRRGLKAGQKIPVPVAFTLTKSDMLAGIVHPSSRILHDSSHHGGFNRTECEEVSEEVVQMITDSESSHLANLAESQFKTSAFFAVSALGELPDAQNRLRSVNPRRVVDPLLWLLWKRGHIQAQK